MRAREFIIANTQGLAKGSLNEFSTGGDDGQDPLDAYPCYDCGSTIFLHHTKSCELAEPDAIRDLPEHPGTQHWTGRIPKGLHPIPGLQEGVAEGLINESALFLNPNAVIVGQEHGRPLDLSPETLKRVKAIAAKHGAWYEGDGGDRAYTQGQIDRYQGSWDDEVAKTASPDDPKWLYVLFANVDENRRIQRVGADPKDTIFNRLLATASDNSFQGMGFTAQALKKFLAMASEGEYDFVRMSQQPATQENLTQFFKAGEALMWPANWEQYPNRAGKIAKAATVGARDQYLASRKSGVYVVGSGHLKAVQQLTGKQGVSEGTGNVNTVTFFRGEPILSPDRLQQLKSSIGGPYPIYRKSGSPANIGTYITNQKTARGYITQALAGQGKGGAVTEIQVDPNSFRDGDGGIDEAVIITNIAGLVSEKEPDDNDPLRIQDRKQAMLKYLGPGVKKYLNDPLLSDPRLVKRWYDPEFAQNTWKTIKSGQQAVSRPGQNQTVERMKTMLGPLAEKIRRDPEIIDHFIKHAGHDWVEYNLRMNSDGSGTRVVDVKYYPPTKQGVAEGWRENLAAAGIAGALATGTPAPAQAQATAATDPIVATLQIDGETRRLDLSSKGFQDVREAERWLADFMRARGIQGWQGKIERGTPGTGRYQRVTIQGAGGLDEQQTEGHRR